MDSNSGAIVGSVLVVDDDRRLCSLLRSYLTDLGFSVSTIHRGDEALRAVRVGAPDVVVLDVMLPGMDGFDVCRHVRTESRVPIIMLTARGDVTDRVVGLELGADDYLPKPFEPRELVARIRAVLRRGVTDTPETWLGNELRVDFARRATWLRDSPIDLTSAEFDLLEMLIKARGRVLTRAFLLDGMRGQNWESFDRSIDVMISRVRQKLGDDPRRPVFIRTVRGIGYCFVGGETHVS